MRTMPELACARREVELDLLGGFGDFNVAFITVEDDG